MKSEKIYLKDYESPSYNVESIHLDFNLNEDICTVLAKTNYVAHPGSKAKSNELVLNGGEGLKLTKLLLNGEALSESQYRSEKEALVLLNPPSQFELIVETKLEPQNNTALEGLYKSSGIFCTQCEAQGFRRITYFLDRPDVMTKYSVTIEANKKNYPVLLSNGDRLKVEDLGNGRHKSYWADPHKKPCYLFALVAGDLGVIKDTFKTLSGKKVELEVYAPHGKQERCLHAMDSLKKSMKWDEDTFGLEYDLGTYMVVSIDDFNAGAMENKGLNIFNSRLVLADSQSATDQDFFKIESVVAHEYFHNWTGNRVTLANWFQLSLKEGLTVFRDQEFSADQTDRGVQRINDVDALRARQFAEDAGPNSHPVRPDSCMSVDNFFTMTIYEKGAEVIRMMQTIVGRKGFRKGMDEYFRRHDGQAVTTDDFAAAISEPNGKDFTQFKRWYTQAGTPRVSVTESYNSDKKEYSLVLKQSCPETAGQSKKEPFHIPLMVALLDPQGREMSIKCPEVFVNSDGKKIIELKKTEETYRFQGVDESPVLSILREFSAPIYLDWNANVDHLYFLMEKDTDSFNRREMVQKLSLQVLKSLVSQASNNQPLNVDSRFVNAMGTAILDERMDPGFKECLLTLPIYSIIAQNENVLEALAFEKARETLLTTIAEKFKQGLLNIYLRFNGVDPTSRDSKVFAHRALKNLALSYLSRLKDPEITNLIVRQYQSAENMTDKNHALNLLAHLESTDDRNVYIQSFYDTWKHDNLVMNKWLIAQASSIRTNCLEDVKALCKHPAFNITNPNNVYSLLGAFGGNLIRFHDPRVNAYQFFADKILEIDPVNPQVAARLCSAFNFTSKLNPEMKDRALKEIRRMVANKNLSKNSRELLQTMVTS